jgi:hypothetical protein
MASAEVGLDLVALVLGFDQDRGALPASVEGAVDRL